jgi:probable sporulation protein (polysaccharide deacetylase family)
VRFSRLGVRAVRRWNKFFTFLALIFLLYGVLRFTPQLFTWWFAAEPQAVQLQNEREQGEGLSENGESEGVVGETMNPPLSDPQLDRAALEELVAEAARHNSLKPVEATPQPQYQAVIPELNGAEIDQQATVEALFAAAPGEEIPVVWKELRPSVTQEDFPGLLIYRGNPQSRRVSFMVNVAWGNEFLPEMLSVLDEQNVKTTFFPVGRWAENSDADLRLIHNQGHELGNHGYSDHEVFPDLNLEQSIESLELTNEIIYEISGQKPHYFTPHKGEYNETTLEACRRLGMRLLLWTLDTVDWQHPGEETMANRILDRLEPGAIILMHPTEQSAGFLQRVIPEIHEQGLEIVTISELLSPTPAFPDLTLMR